MTKRLHFTLEEVLDDVLSDDEDLDDPDEPMMEGSDDDFSDLELDEDEDDIDSAMDTTGAQGYRSTDPSLSSSSQRLRVDPPTSPGHSSLDSLTSSGHSLSQHSSLDPPTSPAHSLSQHSSLDSPTSSGHSLSPLTSPSTSQQSPGSQQTPAPLPQSWSEQLAPVTIQPFTSRVGPTVAIPDSPLEVFELFFTTDLQQKIVDETNRYAKQVMGDVRYSSWTKITRQELKAFIGFSILMGINRLPSLDDYWSKDPLLHYSPISNRIPRWRFREISRYLHFVNNDDLAPRGDPMYDRLGKVRPLIDHLSSKFSSLYEPSKDVAVDEAMIKFQGRSALKQYMPMKPIKRGIKVWVLGDSTNGYFSRFQVYTGRQETREVGLGAHVVKTLTGDLKHKYHHVYFDNFFTSVQLLEDLEEDGIYGCGTARKDRRGFPPALKAVRLRERGESKTVQKGKVTAHAWMDNKVVTVMSTNSQPSATGTVLRRKKDGSRIPVPCPESVILYNRWMGAVDHGDQLRGYYSCRTKSRKFYKYIYHFLVDVTITNSFILYKNFHPNPRYKTIREFRLQLARELIGDYCSRRRPGCHGGVIIPLQLQHFPTTVSSESGPRKTKRGRCARCSKHSKRTDSQWFCQECGVWLCHNGDTTSDCFYLWHKNREQ